MDFYYLIELAPCRAVLMTAHALGIELNKIPLDLKEGEHLTPQFLANNPQHTTPTLVDDGLALWESRAIMIYLTEKCGKSDAASLYPKYPEQRALINQRLYFDMALYPVFRAYYYPQVIEKRPADLEALKKLEIQLQFLNTFLEGELL